MTTDLIDSVETEKRPATQGADYDAPAQVIVRNLTKRYGDLTAVAGVSFDVRSGEVFGLLGPNGAGSRESSFARPGRSNWPDCD